MKEFSFNIRVVAQHMVIRLQIGFAVVSLLFVFNCIVSVLYCFHAHVVLVLICNMRRAF